MVKPLVPQVLLELEIAEKDPLVKPGEKKKKTETLTLTSR